MAKNHTVFICSECGNSEPKWVGRCAVCGAWNTYVETEKTLLQKEGTKAGAVSASVPLLSVSTEGEHRMDCGIPEMNRVLGGGLVPGAAVLVGGEPGIGKSTLLMQIAEAWKNRGTVLYVSGEESARQLKLRSDRLGVTNPNINLLCETSLERMLSVFEKEKTGMVIVDSIQTVISSEAGSIPSTVNQIKYCAYEWVSRCKEKEIPLFLIAHVTKEGQIAGPKILEHMVDTVLYFEHGEGDIRILRAVKNRFGASDETGFFLMKKNGLATIEDPTTLFVENREGPMPDGVASAAVFEGTRSFPVEVQALAVASKATLSRTFSDRVESQRVSRLAAVLEKTTGIRFSDRDLYINVAGGFRLKDQGADLALVAALYSARTGIPVQTGTILAGEVSLAGEIRAIPHLDRRVKAAQGAGYRRIVLPKGKFTLPKNDLEVVQCADIVTAMEVAVGAVSPKSG